MSVYDNLIAAFIGMTTLFAISSMLHERMWSWALSHYHKETVSALPGWRMILPDLAFRMLRIAMFAVDAFTNLYVIIYPWIALAGPSEPVGLIFGSAGDSMESDQGVYTTLLIMVAIGGLFSHSYAYFLTSFFGFVACLTSFLNMAVSVVILILTAAVPMYTITTGTTAIEVIFFSLAGVRVFWHLYNFYIAASMWQFSEPDAPKWAYHRSNA